MRKINYEQEEHHLMKMSMICTVHRTFCLQDCNHQKVSVIATSLPSDGLYSRNCSRCPMFFIRLTFSNHSCLNCVNFLPTVSVLIYSKISSFSCGLINCILVCISQLLSVLTLVFLHPSVSLSR